MIEVIAHYLQLDIWDWIAVAVALLSFIVAMVSLRIAWKTLKSQQQTAANTMPVVSIGAQYESMISIMILIIENYINSLVLKIKIDDIGGKWDKSDILLSVFKINTADIHLELFYEDNLIDSEYNDLLQRSDIEDSFVEKSSPYRIIAEYRNHLEEFNQNCQMLELQYINSTLSPQDSSSSYAMYVMRESIELILHTSSITSFLYPKHNIGKTLLSYLKKTEESCLSRMQIEEKKINDKNQDQEMTTTRFMALLNERAWREIYDTNQFGHLNIMKYEEMKSAISTIAYCRYKYGAMRDYFIYR